MLRVVVDVNSVDSVGDGMDSSVEFYVEVVTRSGVKGALYARDTQAAVAVSSLSLSFIRSSSTFLCLQSQSFFL